MKYYFENRQGKIAKRIVLGNVSVRAVFTWNSSDEHWMLNLPGLVLSRRINKGRKLYENRYGYLVNNTDVSKTGFNHVEWVSNAVV